MVWQRARQSAEWVTNVISQPREELNRWQAAVRFSYELGVHGWKALQRDNAPQMAAALSFRTLFALLPVVVVSAALVNAMQGPEQFKQIVHWLINAAGLNQMVVEPSEAIMGPLQSDEEVAAGVNAAAREMQLGTWVEQQVQTIANLRLATLGWIGMAVLVYSAISLMVTIENGFNTIYGAPEGRAWTKRILTYWFVLTLGPLIIGLTVYIDRQMTELLLVAGNWKWLLSSAQWLWGLSIAWLFMIAVYRLVPNTQVTMRAAMIGALVAAIFLQVGKSILSAYFGNAVLLGNIYGTLGAVPVVMFWVYMMWLVVLFGLEVSATIQRVQNLHVEELHGLTNKQPQSGLVDPASVVTVMEYISEKFLQGKAATTREIADETVIAEGMVFQMVERLIRAGFLHRVDGEKGAVSLARVPDQISAEHLIEIGYSLVDEGQTGRQSNLVQRLRDAQRKLAAQATMAHLIQPKLAHVVNQTDGG